jgi:hypothetical protein
MPVLTFTLSVDLDGVPLPNFPLIRRQQTNTAIPIDGAAITANNNTTSFSAVPGLDILTTDLQFLILTTDQLINLKFNAASYLPLTAGAVLAIFGTDITGTVATLATVNNPAAAVASNVIGALGGT